MRYKIFTSSGYIAMLILLILNDFYLKIHFHNWTTGKLSDFAGLFVFPLFWCAFFPKRQTLIFVTTGVLFGVWKSPQTQWVIEFWNEVGIGKISRTVDYSDYIAILILPFASQYFRSAPDLNFLRLYKYPSYMVIVLSALAIMGTSFVPQQIVERRKLMVTDYKLEPGFAIFDFGVSREHLLEKIREQGFEIEHRYVFAKDRWDIVAKSSCVASVVWGHSPTENASFDKAVIDLKNTNTGSSMHVSTITLCNIPEKRSSEEALAFFENYVLRQTGLGYKKEAQQR